MARIVVVDDEPDIREMLADFLGGAGHAVLTAADGPALDALLAGDPGPDLFVLDVGLPGRDGFTLARELRAQPRPGRHPDADRRTATPSTASSASRSAPTTTSPSRWRCPSSARASPRCCAGGARRRRPRPARRSVPTGSTCAPSALRDAAGRELDLSPMEVDLVAAFATNPGRTLTRDDLLRLAPPRDGESSDRSIDHRVNRLRRKLEAESGLSLIRTVRGVGYVHLPV